MGREVSRPNRIFDRAVGLTALYLLHSNFDEQAKTQAARAIADWLTCLDNQGQHIYPENFSLTAAILFPSVEKQVQMQKERLCGSKYYPYSDYLVVRREDWFCGLRMCSVRVKNWFSIHNENKKGWFTGEGTLALMTDGREYDEGVIFCPSTAATI